MKNCAVCGTRILENQKKCALCGTKLDSEEQNVSKKTIFSIGKIEIDLLDLIVVIILGLFSLTVLIDFFKLFSTLTDFIFKVLYGLPSLLGCLAYWGLFIYYKTNEKIIKIIDGVFILGNIFSVILYYIIFIISTNYIVSLFDLLDALLLIAVTKIVPFVLIVLKNKKE